jgi:transposase
MGGSKDKTTTEPAGAPQRSQQAGGGEPAGGPWKRLSARRKLEAVKRLQRGEPLELLSREFNVTAARLSEWRDRVEQAAETALKERERDDRDDEIARLKGKVGEMTMANELLQEKIARLEAGGPLARRRSRR